MRSHGLLLHLQQERFEGLGVTKIKIRGQLQIYIDRRQDWTAHHTLRDITLGTHSQIAHFAANIILQLPAIEHAATNFRNGTIALFFRQHFLLARAAEHAFALFIVLAQCEHGNLTEVAFLVQNAPSLHHTLANLSGGAISLLLLTFDRFFLLFYLFLLLPHNIHRTAHHALHHTIALHRGNFTSIAPFPQQRPAHHHALTNLPRGNLPSLTNLGINRVDGLIHHILIIFQIRSPAISSILTTSGAATDHAVYRATVL
mmetsp:Transcript_12741/g.19227  ORF Transcript_12741/g.19227 Transcript_12741/m.19227 type:complete len:258 (-) Transcript_12741:1888-2661(-)